MPLADVFKAVNKDLHMAPFAKSGEKQEKCAPGYFWCPIDKECKKDKSKKVKESIMKFQEFNNIQEKKKKHIKTKGTEHN